MTDMHDSSDADNSLDDEAVVNHNDEDLESRKQTILTEILNAEECKIQLNIQSCNILGCAQPAQYILETWDEVELSFYIAQNYFHWARV